MGCGGHPAEPGCYIKLDVTRYSSVTVILDVTALQQVTAAALQQNLRHQARTGIQQRYSRYSSVTAALQQQTDTARYSTERYSNRYSARCSESVLRVCHTNYSRCLKQFKARAPTGFEPQAPPQAIPVIISPLERR